MNLAERAAEELSDGVWLIERREGEGEEEQLWILWQRTIIKKPR